MSKVRVLRLQTSYFRTKKGREYPGDILRRTLPQKNVNVAVAAYVITQARLKLYGYLRELGEPVWYCIRDSMNYIQKVNETKREKRGDYLGDLTDELEEYAQAPTLRSLSRVALKTTRFLSFVPPMKTNNEM